MSATATSAPTAVMPAGPRSLAAVEAGLGGSSVGRAAVASAIERDHAVGRSNSTRLPSTNSDSSSSTFVNTIRHRPHTLTRVRAPAACTSAARPRAACASPLTRIDLTLLGRSGFDQIEIIRPGRLAMSVGIRARVAHPVMLGGEGVVWLEIIDERCDGLGSRPPPRPQPPAMRRRREEPAKPQHGPAVVAGAVHREAAAFVVRHPGAGRPHRPAATNRSMPGASRHRPAAWAHAGCRARTGASPGASPPACGPRPAPGHRGSPRHRRRRSRPSSPGSLTSRLMSFTLASRNTETRPHPTAAARKNRTDSLSTRIRSPLNDGIPRIVFRGLAPRLEQGVTEAAVGASRPGR